MALSMCEAIGMSDTYTLSGQNVYVLSAKRIRFTRGGYTSYSKSLEMAFYFIRKPRHTVRMSGLLIQEEIPSLH